MSRLRTVRIEFGWGDRSIDWLTEDVEGTSEELINRLLSVIPESYAEGTSDYRRRVHWSTGFPRVGSQWDYDVVLEEAQQVWDRICGCLVSVGRSFAEFEGIAYRVDGYDDGSPISGLIVQGQCLRTFDLPHRTTGDFVSMSDPVPLSAVPAYRFEDCYAMETSSDVDWVTEGF